MKNLININYLLNLSNCFNLNFLNHINIYQQYEICIAIKTVLLPENELSVEDYELLQLHHVGVQYVYATNHSSQYFDILSVSLQKYMIQEYSSIVVKFKVCGKYLSIALLVKRLVLICSG